MRKKLIYALTASLLAVTSVRATTNVFDFNSDPSGVINVIKGEEANSGGQAGAWFSTDGSTLEAGTHPSTNGYLQITAGTNPSPGAFGHRAVIIFDDFDNGLVVAGFRFQCDVRIGAGTQPPADGFSINYARGNDPVITQNDGGGFASSPGGEANLPEEGTQTGLSICFDAWDSGSGDVIGLTIRVDNVIRTNFPLPTLNGLCADPTSMQTGTNDMGVAGLCWQPLYAELTTNDLLHVSYKGVALLTNYSVNFASSPGRLVFAGRVGGSNQKQDVDNIRLVTIPASSPVVGPSTFNANGFKFTISDSGSATPNTNSLVVKLNDVVVVPTSITQSGNIGGGNGVTAVAYQNPSLVLAAGSTNSIAVQFTGTGFSGSVSVTNSFTVPSYSFMTTAEQAPGTVNTSLTGFGGRVHQLPIGRFPGNQHVALIEKQLAAQFIDPSTGLPYATVASGGVSNITDADVINWGQDALSNPGIGDVGTFRTSATPPHNWGDEPIPGIDLASTTTDNIAAELLTVLHLPVGAYELGVNHDDGYKLSVGPEPRNMFAARILASNNGAADNAGTRIVVTNAGYYPVRLLWGENGGGAGLEFYLVDFVSGNRVLINNTTNPVFIAAYSDIGALTHPYVVSVYPNGIANWGIQSSGSIVVKFQDGTAGTVLDGSITINGLTPTISNSGGETTASLTGGLAVGPQTATLVYSTSLGGPFTNTWTFDVYSSKTDVTVPGDPITAYSTLTTTSPGAEGVTNAIANNLQKYLRFNNNVNVNGHHLGFVVTPSAGATVVTGLRHFCANDADARDPVAVVLQGSVNGGGSWHTIYSGNISMPAGRNGAGETFISPTNAFMSEVSFPNTLGFTSYRWYTTLLKGNVNLMQIAEVELLGTPGTPAPYLSVAPSGASDVLITANQAGTLQASPSPSGGWTNVGPITTTLTIPHSAPGLFYRLQVP